MAEPALMRAVTALVADLDAQAREHPGDFQIVSAEDPTDAYVEFDSVNLERAVRAALAAAARGDRG